jgi:hypothetical protein
VTRDLVHLASIGPLALRVPAARSRLGADATAAAPQLEAILRDAGRGDERARKSLLACSIAIAQDGSEAWIDALAREACRQELPILGALLRDGEPHLAIQHPGRLSDPCVSETHAMIFASLSLLLRARWHGLRSVRILGHPAPEVVRRLLRSPGLRLEEALVIASRRPTSDAIVREVLLSLRWLARTEIREALVANPFVRLRAALALLPTLLAPARRALGHGSVHPLVLQAAAALG